MLEIVFHKARSSDDISIQKYKGFTKCLNRGFDTLHSTTELYSVKYTYLYLKFIFYHVISFAEQFVLF